MIGRMGTLISLTMPCLIALAALVWGVIIVRAWAPAAARRGGHWALEAILVICGPITTVTIALYPEDGSSSGPFPAINRAATLVAVALAALITFKAVHAPRKHAGVLLAAVAAFYGALGVSTFAGAVPAFPEAYWTTPLILLAFLMYDGYSSEWLLRMARIVLRIILLLSLAAMFLMPNVAFNLEESRTVFGIHRLQGVMTHPNGFAALVVLGFFLELHARTRLGWRLIFVAAAVLAQSSTGVIALVLGLLVMQNALSKFARVLIYLAGTAALLAATFGAGGWVMATFLPEQSATFTGRTAIWAAALQGFRLSPIFGYGPTLLGDEFRNRYLPNFSAAAQAHNQWMQTLGGEGLIGAASLVILGLVLIVAAARTRDATAGLSVALVVFLIIRCVTETPLRPGGPGAGTMMLIVVFGLIAATPSEQGSKAEPKAAAAPRPDWAKPRSGTVRERALR